MNDQQKLSRNIERAARSYKESDTGRWAAAFYAAQVVGKNQIGATLSLADRMGVSVDTVENLAHAYQMYSELRAEEHYRQAVRMIRRAPYIYYSYFRSLYKARINYGLTLDQVYSLLLDMLLAEGALKLGDLDQHIQDRYGDSRNWTFYAKKAQKEIHKTLQQPDLPKDVKDVLIPAFNKLGDQA